MSSPKPRPLHALSPSEFHPTLWQLFLECRVERVNIIERMRAEDARRVEAKKLKVKGAQKSALARDEYITVRIHPLHKVDLKQIAHMNGTSMATMACHIIQAVTYLWSCYPYDRELYLKRCEFVGDADVAIDPSYRGLVQGRTRLEDLTQLFAQFDNCVWTMMTQGVSKEQLRNEFEAALATWKEEDIANSAT